MKKVTILSSFAAVAFASTSSAAVIFSTDFNSETIAVSDPLTTGITRVGHSSVVTDVVAATGTFGTQSLEISSRQQAANVSYGFSVFDGATTSSPATYSSVTTFNFDVEMTTAATQFRLRARDTAFSGGTTDTVRFDLNTGGGATQIAVGVQTNVSFVINNTLSSATAPFEGSTIAAGSYAIFFDGAQVETGTNFTAADGLAVDQLTLWVRGDTVNNTPGVVRIDNFAVYDNVVPEPSAYALLSGALALGLVMVRRRRA
ncbi:MAG: PEP-CTERM sorting domain-containing protein [Opitutaceae bacterium]